MFLFTENKFVNSKNMEMLEKTSSSTNPVAKITCDYTKAKHECGKGIDTHFDNGVPKVSLLCIGAKVSLCSKNFKPR